MIGFIVRVALDERLPQLVSRAFEVVLVDEEPSLEVGVSHSPTFGQQILFEGVVFKLLRDPLEVGLTVFEVVQSELDLYEAQGDKER